MTIFFSRATKSLTGERNEIFRFLAEKTEINKFVDLMPREAQKKRG